MKGSNHQLFSQLTTEQLTLGGRFIITVVHVSKFLLPLHWGCRVVVVWTQESEES